MPFTINLFQIIALVILAFIGGLVAIYILIVTGLFIVGFTRFRLDRKYIYARLFGFKWTNHLAAMEQTNLKYRTLKHEDIHIMHDGLKLHGYFYENPSSKKIVVFIHGYYSFGLNDIGAHNNLYDRLGVSLLIVDQRASGRSGGNLITFGLKERYDLLAWVKYLDHRYFGKKDIYLSGGSMGASTALLTASLPNLPSSLKGVIADSAYTRPISIALSAATRVVRFTPTFLLFGLNLYCKIFGNFTLSQIKVDRELTKNTTVPILFIHGTDDLVTPIAMAKKNYAACQAPKRLLEVEHAIHCEAVRFAPQLVYPAVRRFIYE